MMSSNKECSTGRHLEQCHEHAPVVLRLPELASVALPSDASREALWRSARGVAVPLPSPVLPVWPLRSLVLLSPLPSPVLYSLAASL